MNPVLLALSLGLASLAAAFVQAPPRQDVVTLETLTLVDRARSRQIPIAVYRAPRRQDGRLKPAIISHGYGGKNTDYTFIAEYLATHGFHVVSIQHQLPDDEPLPATGNPYETRKPSWESGVRNILFVLAELKRTQPGLDFSRLLLAGHSHGGDTSMLFAQEHPSLVDTVISLDHKRMPMPRTKRPRMLSIRSSDQRADDGVIPSAEEQAALGMMVVTLPATIHNDMWDGATGQQKAEIIRHIDRFLRQRN